MDRTPLITSAVCLGLFGVAQAGDNCRLDRTSNLLPAGTVAHVRVIFGEDPARKAIISWSSAEDGNGEHTAKYRKRDCQSSSNGSWTTVAAAESGQYKGDKLDFYHHARLEGLDADSCYDVKVTSDGNASAVYWFKTAPDDPDQAFRLLVGGDSRTDDSSSKVCADGKTKDPDLDLYGRKCRQNMNDRMRKRFKSKPEIVALAHGGDYVKDGSSWRQWCAWLDDHEATTGDGRLLPIIPARGNHEDEGDYAALYDEIFGQPGLEDNQSPETINAYVTRIGAFALLTLNSELPNAEFDDAADWIEGELRELVDDDYRWISATYHKPAYPAAKSFGETGGDSKRIRDHWVPLFGQYGVNLVFESDGHAFKRTLPMLNLERFDRPSECVPDECDTEKDESVEAKRGGVVYVGEGGLGAPLRDPHHRAYLENDVSGDFLHVMELKVRADELVLDTIYEDGDLADRLRLKPRTVVPFESEWAYNDAVTTNLTGFDAFNAADVAGWSVGRGMFGEGEGAFDGVDGADADNTALAEDQASVYFYKEIDIDHAVDFAEMSVWYEDGIAVYVNGTLVFKRNIEADPLDHDDCADSNTGGGALELVDEDEDGAALADAFNPNTTNHIAVVLKRWSSTAGFSFDMRLTVSED